MSKTNALISRNTTPVVQVSQLQARASELAENTYLLAENAAFRNTLRAAYAKQVLDNTATLVSIEAHYNQIAPGWKELYHAIVQAYAQTSLLEIMGGGWK